MSPRVVDFDQVDHAHRNADAVFEVHRFTGESGTHPGDAWINTMIASLQLGKSVTRRDVSRAWQYADYWSTDGGAQDVPDRRVWVERFAEDLGLQVAPGLPESLVESVGYALCVHEHGEDEADILWEDEQRLSYLKAARVALKAAESHRAC